MSDDNIDEVINRYGPIVRGAQETVDDIERSISRTRELLDANELSMPPQEVAAMLEDLKTIMPAQRAAVLKAMATLEQKIEAARESADSSDPQVAQRLSALREILQEGITLAERFADLSRHLENLELNDG